MIFSLLLYFVILLVSLLLIIVLVGFFLPQTSRVSRSLVIKAPKETLFNLVNDLREWEKWSPWYSIDPNMKITYHNGGVGKGASYSWTSDHKRVGSGSLAITNTTDMDRIDTELNFTGQDPGQGEWHFEEVSGGVEVTWVMNATMGANPLKRYFGLLFDRMLGPQFEEGLRNIKREAEAA